MNAAWQTQLAPDRAPAPVGWWPPAPGWWALLLIGALLAAALFFWWRNPRRRRQRAALRELAQIRARGADPVTTAQALQDLLRRYAVAVCGRERIARLSGTAWLAFLRQYGGLDADVGRSLLRSVYGAKPPIDRSNPDRVVLAAAGNANLRATTKDQATRAGTPEDWRKQWLLTTARFIRRLRPASALAAATASSPTSASVSAAATASTAAFASAAAFASTPASAPSSTSAPAATIAPGGPSP